jgi:hypothetical protein
MNIPTETFTCPQHLGGFFVLRGHRICYLNHMVTMNRKILDLALDGSETTGLALSGSARA